MNDVAAAIALILVVLLFLAWAFEGRNYLLEWVVELGRLAASFYRGLRGLFRESAHDRPEYLPPRLSEADLRVCWREAEREVGIYHLSADGREWILSPEFHGTGRPKVWPAVAPQDERRLLPRPVPVPRRNPSGDAFRCLDASARQSSRAILQWQLANKVVPMVHHYEAGSSYTDPGWLR